METEQTLPAGKTNDDMYSKKTAYSKIVGKVEFNQSERSVNVDQRVSPKTADTKEIDVWRIEAKDSGSAYYEHDISIVEDMLKSCDYDDGYIITKHKMDKGKYEALPEFTGF